MKVIDKLWKWFKEFMKKPLLPDQKKKRNLIQIQDLQYKTKAQLEEVGRKMGLELDKRLTKAKLISQLKKAVKDN
tara:strand:- start:265 stop:489 length:225 start_codon:yes stop_codon:yes gene_type:complete